MGGVCGRGCGGSKGGRRCLPVSHCPVPSPPHRVAPLRAPCPAVPWTFARLSCAALGVAAPDEAPVGFLRSSASPRTFWRNYHVRRAALG